MIFAPHKFDTRLAEHNRSMHRIIILQSKTKYIYAHGVILDYSPHTLPSGRATIVRPNPPQRCQFYHSFEHPTLTNCVKVSSAIQKICIVLQFWGYEVREGHLGDVKNSHFASVRRVAISQKYILNLIMYARGLTCWKARPVYLKSSIFQRQKFRGGTLILSL